MGIDVLTSGNHIWDKKETFERLLPGDIVRARRSAEVVTLLHPTGYNYYTTLRQKLHWSVMPAGASGRM